MSRWVSSSQAMLFTLTCCLEVVFQEITHYPVNCVKDKNLIYNGVFETFQTTHVPCI